MTETATGGQLVPLVEIAGRLGVTIEHVRAWAGEDAVRTDWSGLPACTVETAARVVAWYHEEEQRRHAEDRAATLRREERDRAVRARYEQLASEQRERLRKDDRAVDHWGGGIVTPTSAIVKLRRDLLQELWAQAEREVDKEAGHRGR